MVDIRSSMNAISEVIVNRPPPIREFDQIYMRAGDMLLHIDHICHWFNGLDIAFVGDGDAVGLALIYLHHCGLVEAGPKSIHIFDFDERMIGSVERFAKLHGLTDRITASYYNVRDPLPDNAIGHFGGFHTNPPYGKSNGGKSVDVFVRRGIEVSGPKCRACVVLADDDELEWTQDVLFSVQQSVVASGFMVSELRPKAHRYHLDDAPELTSCTLLVRRQRPVSASGGRRSFPITPEECRDFYGRNNPLTVRKVKDKTAAGRFPSRDHEIEPFDDSPKLFEGDPP